MAERIVFFEVSLFCCSRSRLDRNRTFPPGLTIRSLSPEVRYSGRCDVYAPKVQRGLLNRFEQAVHLKPVPCGDQPRAQRMEHKP